jgi:hypothetical protein
MDKQLRNSSGRFQRNAVYKDNIFMGNYKLSDKGSKSKCKIHESADNSVHRNQQSLTKEPTYAIPIVNGLTSVDVSKKTINHRLKSSAQNKGHKIVIIGDSHARGCPSNMKHNLNDSYKSSGYIIRDIYFSKFQSLLRFGMLFWGGLGGIMSTKLFRLQKRVIRFMVRVNSRTSCKISNQIQKRIMRIITNCNRRDSCRQLYKQLQILPLKSQYIFSILLFVVKNRDVPIKCTNS